MEASEAPKDPAKETPPTEEEKAGGEGQKYDGGDIPRSSSPEEKKKD